MKPQDLQLKEAILEETHGETNEINIHKMGSKL